MMVNQILSVIDDKDWVVQIFYDPNKKMAVEGTMYPGIQRQVERGRVLLTPIPKRLTKKVKRNRLLLNPWLWENMLAESVLMFGGTSVLCANAPELNGLDDMMARYDYVGVPWKMNSGVGGSGAISLRNRTHVLSFVKKLEADTKQEVGDPFKRVYRKEDILLVEYLRKVGAKLADEKGTMEFGMSDTAAQGKPLAASGTLPQLEDDTRQKFIDYCPEMKMMYPSLHSPACFGANPDPINCFKFLCITGKMKCSKNPSETSFTDIDETRVTITMSTS
eukprot:CAMPEP_0174955448 /NCGR_PEP_ID=MMETSP0004_2-20121128/985_1 /TAXON_ID=420556 /ORGANISM="Ochromonas sp., Strain CCMP1393" /LENGTH=276 /DNA_ID=CAMNT_0016203373 /DNA_START=294 /DNA_END=1124 /DNA_ORIENTATION=-